MEFISKFPYEQYQIFARSRENLEEDNRRYQEEKFRRLAIDIRQLEGLAKTAKLWERKELEQPKFPGQPFNMFPGPAEDGTIMISIGKHVYMFENREEFQKKIRNYRLFVLEESMKKKIESKTRGQRGNSEEDHMEECDQPEFEEDEGKPRKTVSNRKAEKRKASVNGRSVKTKRKSADISPAMARFKEEWDKKKFKEEEARNLMWDSVPIPCGTRGGSIGLESEWSTSDSTRTSVSPAFSFTLRC